MHAKLAHSGSKWALEPLSLNVSARCWLQLIVSYLMRKSAFSLLSCSTFSESWLMVCFCI
jgi:hypothetical protein